ncbi:class I SAM-dependent methyltransferase [Pilimelia columellifera]|uniref:Methyltransferase n=1 Tax=Pilimelia columellifera subsp. columellifera TaxID=706583 RepID=A0ABP6APB6_9ACTN
MTGEHYFSETPSSGGTRRPVEFAVGGRDYRLSVAGGVFSAGRLDQGTGVLLRKAPLPGPDEPGPLLDLGCGYGPIACVLADRAATATVYAVDVNSRARELTAANASTLGVADRLRVCAPDDVPDDVAFRQIWSNPPIRIGKDGLHELLLRWLPRLTPDGVAWLVVARHLGADSLQEWLAGRGFVAERQASQKGFRVLRVTAAD